MIARGCDFINMQSSMYSKANAIINQSNACAKLGEESISTDNGIDDNEIMLLYTLTCVSAHLLC
jgi:hypothetical protein